jgi:hypothetical protein
MTVMGSQNRTSPKKKIGPNQKHHVDSLDDLSHAKESLFLLYWVNHGNPKSKTVLAKLHR